MHSFLKLLKRRIHLTCNLLNTFVRFAEKVGASTVVKFSENLHQYKKIPQKPEDLI